MAQRRNVLLEQFFNGLIAGDRRQARHVVDQALDQDVAGPRMLTHLFWPVLEQIQHLHRHDQLSDLAYHYATRLLRQFVDQQQLRLDPARANGVTVLLVCGDDASEQIAGQMATDLLEAAGYTVFFPGGGVANDEIVEQLGRLQAHKLVIFGALPATVPYTRLLIDRLHGIGACPDLQIIVGGGVFGRAEGLAEEIGADLWAHDPAGLVRALRDEPGRRMTRAQRTVGRRRPSSNPPSHAKQSQAA